MPSRLCHLPMNIYIGKGIFVTVDSKKLWYNLSSEKILLFKFSILLIVPAAKLVVLLIRFLLVAMTINEVIGIAHTLLAGCYDHK